MSDIKTVLEKLDKLDSRIDNIDITLAKQHVSLDEHIRRTNLLEEKLEPVEKHVIEMQAAKKTVIEIGKLLGAFGGLVLFIIAVYQFVKTSF